MKARFPSLSPTDWSLSPRGLRRSIYVAIGVFMLLCVAAVIGFQDNLFRYWHNPQTPFQTSPAPQPPDYAQADAWLLRPEERLAEAPDTPAIFFIHPTTVWGGEGWNAALDDDVSNQRLLDWIMPTYAGPFLSAGAVWVPRYRQATLYASLTHHYDARRARALAYEDVARAFARFLAEIHPQQPIIIAGIEQGGLHALGLLQHTARMERVRERLIAAYIIDQATPLDLFTETAAPLTPCAAPESVRCVAAWGAVHADDNREIRRYLRRSMAWDLEGRLIATADRALLCVNPVLWTTSEEYAPRRANRGAVNASGFELSAMAEGRKPPVAQGQTSAQCRDGVLLVDEPRAPSLRDPWRWGGRFKPARTNLFFADLEHGLGVRIAAFQAQRAAEEDAG